MSAHLEMKESDYTGYKDMQLLNAAWAEAEKGRRETTYKELSKQPAPDKREQLNVWRNWDNSRSRYDMDAYMKHIKKKEEQLGFIDYWKEFRNERNL